MMPKLRIAVIGVGADRGSRARQYLETITRLTDHYELAAICDRNSKALQEVATQYGVKAHYESVTALFDAEKPDVILSLAPKDSHIVIALTAARHGAHIITEIPVALTRRYAAAIAETCRSTGVLWEVAEQVWLWPNERLKRQIIEAGGIGKLTHARLWYLTGQYHGFNGIRSLLGARATRVLGYCGEVETEPYIAYGGEPESTIKWEHAVIEFDNGVTCLFEKPPRAFPLREQTFSTGWQVEGTKGHFDRNRLTIYGETRPHEITERYTEMEENVYLTRSGWTLSRRWSGKIHSNRIESVHRMTLLRQASSSAFTMQLRTAEGRSTVSKTRYTIGKSVLPSAKATVWEIPG